MGNDVVEIDLKGLVSELWHNKVTVILSTILVAAIFFSSSVFFITPQYEAKAELYVLTKTNSTTSLNDLQVGTSLSDDYMVVVNRRSVLMQVIENLELDMDYKDLEKCVSTSMLSDRILEITVKNPKPDRAVEIAEELAAVSASYISQKMKQDPPTILEHAYSDRNKVEPSLGKNTVIGGIIGFLIAAILVAISVMLNDSIMTTDDVVNKLGISVLGTLPLEHAEYDGGRIRKTPKEFLKSIFLDTGGNTSSRGSGKVLQKKKAARNRNIPGGMGRRK